MGTRSFVGVMVGDVCRAVYVHWDGYIDGVGAEVLSYKTQQEVEKLISHGDRSSLNEGYYKDRGEDWKDVCPQEYHSFDEFFESCYNSGGEYYYIFKDGVWYCGTTSDWDEKEKLHRKLTPLLPLFDFIVK